MSVPKTGQQCLPPLDCSVQEQPETSSDLLGPLTTALPDTTPDAPDDRFEPSQHFSTTRYLIVAASFFARGNRGFPLADSALARGRPYYAFDEATRADGNFFNPIDETATYDLYLDPLGDQLLVSAANTYQGTLIGSAAEGLVSRLYQILGTWPAGMERFRDEQFVALDDGTEQPLLAPPYSGMRWDPRRLFATLMVADFKGALRELLTGSNDTALDDGHRYSRKEMQAFWEAIAGECGQETTLYGEYACREQNAEVLMAKLRTLSELLRSHSKHLSAGDAAGLMRDAGLTKPEIHFLALAARNQYRPEGLPAADYPAYLQCRDVDFDRIFNGDASMTEHAEACLRSGVRIAAEPGAADRSADPFRTHPAPLMDGLAAVRQRALVLSVFSRACQADLDFTSLFRFDPLAAQTDDETNRRCLTSEVAALKSMTDPVAELDRGLLQESREDRALVKSIKAATPEPEQRQPHQKREYFEMPQTYTLLTVALDPKFAEEDPEAKGTSDSGKPDGKAPEKGAKGPPTKQQIREAIQKTLARAAADPKHDAKQKAAIEKLAKDEKKIAGLEKHYESLTREHQDDTSKAIERIEKNLTAAIDKTFEPRAEKKKDAPKADDQVAAADVKNDGTADHTEDPELAADIAEKDKKPDEEISVNLKVDAAEDPQKTKAVDPVLIPEDTSPARVRSQAQLAAAARAELESAAAAIQEGRRPELQMDLGAFFIESEVANAGKITQGRYLKFQRDWKQAAQLSQSAPTPGGSEERLLAAIRPLFPDYLKDYSRDQALLIDFLQGNGGNCEAQTKLILSALQAAKRAPDAPGVVGVQVYADHVQPVLYDPATGLVTNLLTGSRVKGVEAPIYQPQLLLNAYLRGKGEASPLKDEQLLIADVPPAIARQTTALPGQVNGNGAVTAEQIQINDMIARERVRWAVERDLKSREKAITSKLPPGVTFLDVVRATLRVAGSLTPEQIARASRLDFADLSNTKVPRDVVEDVIKRLPTLVGMAVESQIAVGSNTRLVLPSSASRFANGPIPRYANVTPPPDQGNRDAAAPNTRGRPFPGAASSPAPSGGPHSSGGPTSGSFLQRYPIVRAYSPEMVKSDPGAQRFFMRYKNTGSGKSMLDHDVAFGHFIKDDEGREDPIKRAVWFKHREDRLEFERIARGGNETEIAKFINTVHDREVNRMMHGPDYDVALRVMGDTTQYHLLTDEQQRSLTIFMDSVHSAYFDARDSHNGWTSDAYWSVEEKLRDQMHARHPRLERLWQQADRTIVAVEKNPLDLLRYLDAHQDVTDGVFFFLRQTDEYRNLSWDSGGRVNRAIASVISDPRRVGYREEHQGMHRRRGKEERAAADAVAASAAQSARSRQDAAGERIQRAPSTPPPLAGEGRSEGTISSDTISSPPTPHQPPRPPRPARSASSPADPQDAEAEVAPQAGKKRPITMQSSAAEVQLDPRFYLRLMQSVFNYWNPSRMYGSPVSSSSPTGSNLMRRWTPALSRMFDRILDELPQENAESASGTVPIWGVYAEVLKGRPAIPAGAQQYPGPRGEKLPEDIAILLYRVLERDLAWLEHHEKRDSGKDYTVADRFPPFLHEPPYSGERFDGAYLRAQAYLEKLRRTLNGKTRIE